MNHEVHEDHEEKFVGWSEHREGQALFLVFYRTRPCVTANRDTSPRGSPPWNERWSASHATTTPRPAEPVARPLIALRGVKLGDHLIHHWGKPNGVYSCER